MTPPAQSNRHVVIVGFGIPGRFIAELLTLRGISHCVVEQNSAVAQRCTSTTMVNGDARQIEVLRRAGIERASLIAITIPVETAVHEIVKQVRDLRPEVRIIARVTHTSAGLIAQQLGADQVVVAEQLAAREFNRLVELDLNSHPAAIPQPSISE